MSQLSATVTIVRERDPLQGQRLRVLGRMRRGSGVELLVVLSDGSKRLVPAAWTDLDQPGTLPAETTASSSGLALGSVTDLLSACTLVTGLAALARTELEQAARQSPAKEDHRAACSAQSAAADLSGAIGHALVEPVPEPIRGDGEAAIGSAHDTDDGAAAAGWAGGRGGRPDGPADRRGGRARRHGQAGGER
jgi:Family of unknown function (DUF5372)